MQKQSVWIIWIGSIIAMLVGGDTAVSIGRWAFGLTFLAHVVEFVINRSVFEKAGGSMGHHFVQTMIYGFFHWQPIKQRLAAEDSGAGA